mgnify:CR=1 FL=1
MPKQIHHTPHMPHMPKQIRRMPQLVRRMPKQTAQRLSLLERMQGSHSLGVRAGCCFPKARSSLREMEPTSCLPHSASIPDAYFAPASCGRLYSHLRRPGRWADTVGDPGPTLSATRRAGLTREIAGAGHPAPGLAGGVHRIVAEM